MSERIVVNGSVYAVKRDYYNMYATVTGINVDSKADELRLPKDKSASMGTFYELNGNEQFPNIKTIIISNDVRKVSIKNTMFPNVENIVSESKDFESGPLLVYKNHEERVLCNVFCRKEGDVIDLKGISTISDYAFDGCMSENIINTDDVVSCGQHAFDGSKLLFDGDKYVSGVLILNDRILVSIDDNTGTADIPASIQVFPEKFSCAGLDEVVLHKSSHMEKFVMPSIVTLKDDKNIPFDSLCGLMKGYPCNKCEYIDVIDNPYICSVDGVVFSKDKKVLLIYPDGREGTYEIPEGTEIIWERAFSGSNIESVKFPDSVYKIMGAAFSGCDKLSHIDFNSSITDYSMYCGDGIFEYCNNLKDIVIPGHIKVLSKGMFMRCGNIEHLVLSEGVEKICEGAFNAYKQKEIVIPESMKEVERDNFYYSSTVRVIGDKTPYGLLQSVYSHYKRNDGNNILTMIIGSRTLYIPQYAPDRPIMNLDTFLSSFPVDMLSEEEIDDMYTQCGDRYMQQEIAIQMYKLTKKDLYREFLKKSRNSVIKHLFEIEDESRIAEFLSFGFFAPRSLDKFLKTANEKGMTTLAAYILTEQKRKEPKKSTKFNL